MRIKKVLDWFDNNKSVEYDEECRKIISNYKKLPDSDISVVEIKEIIKKDKQKVYDIDMETIIFIDDNGVTWALGSANDSRYLEWLEEGNIPEPWSPEAV